MMRIAIVHFHLQTGGVTRVIQHACQALADAGHKVVVLCGAPPHQPLDERALVRVLPGLGYEESRSSVGPRTLAAAMSQAAGEALGAAPDLWHAHNHSLGKNLALPGALRVLIQAGDRLLLQLHDFAEDGRPALYQRMLADIADQDSARLAELLYPTAPQVHYAVLNARDHAFLAAAGIPPANLHTLPNAITIDASPLGAVSAPVHRPRLWLYPTRSIRRKNIGEFLLWAALGGEQDLFATTQAPLNPTEQPGYRHWVAVAKELKLPVEFEISRRITDYPTLIASSHAFVTTSIAEGFGMAFLEPWLADRPLAGRDLPEITTDFVSSGIDLSTLYPRLPIPLDWIDAKAVQRRMAAALGAIARAYSRPREPNDLDRAWAAATVGGNIDFGRLDEPAQEKVIRLVAGSPAHDLPLTLESPTAREQQQPIRSNRALIERRFMLNTYQDRLLAIYDATTAALPAPISGSAQITTLLDKFLAPERLFLLRI